MTEFYLNDRPINFSLNNDGADFILTDGVINFKLKAIAPEVTTFYRLVEDGGRRLNEDGTFRLLE